MDLKGMGTYEYLTGLIMTICVAGICTFQYKEKPEIHQGIIFATDHMVSIEGLGQFEHKIYKYEMLSNGMMVMISGSITLSEILSDLDFREKGFDESAAIIKKKMKTMRDERVDNEILKRADFSMADVKEILKNKINNRYMGKIVKEVLEYKLDADILLAGFENNLAKLAVITDTSISPFTELGFAAIGSGSSQAFNTLLFQQHSSHEYLYSAVYNIYKAKRNSEVAEGVGKRTDMYFLENNGKPVPITNLALLENVYDEEISYGKNHEKLAELFGVPKDVERQAATEDEPAKDEPK